VNIEKGEIWRDNFFLNEALFKILVKNKSLDQPGIMKPKRG
jgi:hypothetical protein